MGENKYREEMSKVQMFEQKKAEIKRNIYFSSRKEKAAVRAPRKKMSRGKKAAIAVTLSVFVVVAIGVGLLSPNLFDLFDINSPMSAQEHAYISNRVANAQYLPNTEILAGIMGDTSSELSLASQHHDYGEHPDADSAYHEAYIVDDDVLNFDLDGYNALNDQLAFISSTSYLSDTDIYEIKNQIEVVMTIIPGYDQWFMFDLDLIRNYKPYNELTHSYYRLSYDEESSYIHMQMLSGFSTSDIYSKELNMLISGSSAFTNIRNFFDVKYYYNEEGKEVVDCTVITYLKLGMTYYPLMYQRMTNVKDTSLTKYAVCYMDDYELVDTVKLQESNNAYGSDSAYDTDAVYPRGIKHLYIQLNYDSADNITLLKSEHSVGDIHNGDPDLTSLTFYQKSVDELNYINMGWDNSGKRDSWSLHPYNDLNYDYEIEREDIFDTFTKVMPLRKSYCCDDCLRNRISADGVFVDCKHGGFIYDEIYRNDNIVAANDPNNGMFKDIDLAYASIGDTYNRFADALASETNYALTEHEKFSFENSVNEFIYAIAGEMYDEALEFDYRKLEYDTNYWNRTWVKLPNAINILREHYLVIDDLENTTTYSPDLVEYSTSGIVDGTPYDPDKQYYVSLAAVDHMDIEEYVILDSAPVDPSTRTFVLNGAISSQDIMTAIIDAFGPSLKKDDVYEICLLVTEPDEDGNLISCGTVQNLLVSNPPDFSLYIGETHHLKMDDGSYYGYYMGVSTFSDIGIVITRA